MSKSLESYRVRSLDLNLLLTFVVLWDTRSVSRASDHLAVTQPAVSHALRRLRERLGDVLFVPGRNGLSPTARAIELINPIREALDQIYRAIDRQSVFLPDSAQCEFRIAALDFIELWLFPALIDKTHQSARGIVFRCLPIPEPTTIQAFLEAGDINVVIDSQPVTGSGVMCKPLAHMNLVTLVRKQESIRSKRFPLDLFLERPHIVSQQRNRTGNIVEQALSSRGLKRHIAAAVANNLTMAAVAARTSYICTMPVQTAEYLANIFDLSVYKPPIDLPPFSLYYGWHRRFESDPAHRWLLEQITAAFDP